MPASPHHADFGERLTAAVGGRYTVIALTIKIATLGPARPDVAVTLNNLAVVCQRAGDPTRAAALHARALEIFEQALGPEQLRSRVARNNMRRWGTGGPPHRAGGSTPLTPACR